MNIQYTSKILIWYLTRNEAKSATADKIRNLASPVSDSRILLRYYGLISMLQWILYSEKNPSKNPRIHLLTRGQNVMNVLYYPLEHFYWLSAHNVINSSPETRDKAGMWSCRFWMGYVVLYLLQLREEFLDSEKEIRSLRKRLKESEDDKSKGAATKRLSEIKEARKDWLINLAVNSAYLPMTIVRFI